MMQFTGLMNRFSNPPPLFLIHWLSSGITDKIKPRLEINADGQTRVFVFSEPSGLSQVNSAEIVLLKDVNYKMLCGFNPDVLSKNPNKFYTRNPNTSSVFLQHGTALAGRLLSPGTMVNGIPF